MLNLKKFYSDELLHLALILSLLRVDPNSYLGLDIQTVGVGSLDLNNGSGWHTDAHTIIHRPAYVHPKNLDSILLNYERDLFEDLNALGRYNRINTAPNRIHAYLLNIDDKAGPSTTAVTDAENNAGLTNIPNPPMPSQTTNENLESAELTQEDMDLIEVLWKQDVDLGFTLVEPTTTKNSATSSKKESEDDIEKLKTLEAINAAHDKKESEVKEELPKQEDPWAELPYTVDLETGEYILNTGSSGSASGSASSSSSEQQQQQQQQRSLKDPGAEEEEEEQLLGEASLRLGNVDELVGLGDDSLGLSDGLGLENDFTNELLSDGLLNGCAAVDGFLSNDSLTSFNLEEALQLVGLDEVQLEKKPEVKKKNDEDSDGARSESRASTSENDEDAGANSAAAEPPADIMIHTPQYHHPHHPHHRSYQSRVPFMRTMSMEQRWPDITPFFSVPNGTDHFAHPGHHHHHHHHHHPSYTSLGAAAAAGTTAHHHTGYDTAQRNVLLHNATLAPPVGDLNSTGSYHPAGGPSNLGSAVATSMNLTNSSEPMGPDTGSAYKAEPTDMMYYPNTTTDSLNQTTDSIFSALLDEQLGWNNEDLTFNVSDGLYGGSAGGVQSGAENGAAAAAPSLPNIPSTSLGPVADERMDASSDSAVSSMGSERVPSLSDGEWMETGSNSSHTHADSHYSMDYTGKYRMPYDCGYGVAGGARGQRAAMAPVAQKKHHMFGKRCFQEGQGPPMPAAAAATAHQPSPVKYDYEAAAQGVAAAAPPGHAYSGPIEGAAAAPQSEIKYSCSLDFARHHTARSSLEHVHHNHTYHLPPESSTSIQRPVSRDKKSRKSEADEHLTRDEKRARQQSVPIPVHDIINLPMDEFNERLSKYDLSESQLSLIRDIRRRGKNKVAAQNCRKRKLDQINNLSDEVRDMRSRKIRLLDERNYMLSEVARVKEKFGQLYRHIFHSLRDPEGRPYNQHEYSLQLSADGNVVLVPRTGQPGSHYTRSSAEPSKPNKPEQQQQHHHQQQQHHQHHQQHHHHDGRKD